jgi:hypothetical protein
MTRKAIEARRHFQGELKGGRKRGGGRGKNGSGMKGVPVAELEMELGSKTPPVPHYNQAFLRH